MRMNYGHIVIRIQWKTISAKKVFFFYINNEEAPRATISDIDYIASNRLLKIRLNSNVTDKNEGRLPIPDSDTLFIDYVCLR
jgi:hypothetical protein